MSAQRKHLRLMDRQENGPATSERQAAEPHSAANYIVQLVTGELPRLGDSTRLFVCEPIAPRAVGMCAFRLINVGRPDLPYASAEVEYLLKDGQQPLEVDVKLYWRPNRVLPYYAPDGTRLPVTGTVDRVQIYDDTHGLTAEPETDAAGPVGSEELPNEEAIDLAYRVHAASGEPPMVVANHLAATEIARRQWAFAGLQATVDFFSEVALTERYIDYDTYREFTSEQ